MKKIYSSISELIGNTPLLELGRYASKRALSAKIIAKLEYFNPAGSAKDRVALEMIDDAEKSGKLRKGSVIIEPTSGNTGIGLAAVAASRGYRTVIVMPNSMSAERCALMKAYGAELVLTDGALGMSGAIAKAQELAEKYDDAFIAGQFENPANPASHRKTTGPEIWNDTDGEIDIFVAGVGTGGTISGVGEFLKSKKPDIKIVAVEPADSPVLSEGKSGAHAIQGIGAGFIPKTLNTDVYDDIITVSTEQAYSAARDMASYEGILIGVSSGAALFAASKLAALPENKGKNIVVLLPDSGERYLSTPLFDKE